MTRAKVQARRSTVRASVNKNNSVQIRAGASASTSAMLEQSKSGYELTGGFTDRTTGTAGASDVGSNVQYTKSMVQSDTWLRFGIDNESHVRNDIPYWTDPAPAEVNNIGLFGGRYSPAGVKTLFDFDFDDTAVGASSFSAAQSEGDIKYTAASGSYDFSQCVPGDFAFIRFDFNAQILIANTTLQVGLIWQTRLADGSPTYTFTLVTDSIFFGVGTPGDTYLHRPIISAYFASNEDVNARALPAIRADNPIAIQPLTTLCKIVR